MTNCTEITIYKVAKKNMPRVIELSLAVIAEMNADELVIISNNIMQSVDNEEELYWQLTWINHEAVKKSSKKWPDLPSSKELMSLVNEKVYYGHFLDITSDPKK